MRLMNSKNIIEVTITFILTVIVDGLVIIPMGVDPSWHVPSAAFWIVLIGFNGAMVGVATYFVTH